MALSILQLASAFSIGSGFRCQAWSCHSCHGSHDYPHMQEQDLPDAAASLEISTDLSPARIIQQPIHMRLGRLGPFAAPKQPQSKSRKSMRAFMLFFIFSCSFSARCACLISSKVTYADNLSLGLLSSHEA